jgi:hypothetical protein
MQPWDIAIVVCENAINAPFWELAADAALGYCYVLKLELRVATR